jgi:glycosyltransferase involved in cell wall biosynthesis
MTAVAAKRDGEAHDRDAAPSSPHVAFVMGKLNSGGVQRMTMLIAEGVASRGVNVDLVVCDAQGALKDQISPSTSIVALTKSNPIAARWAALRADPKGISAYLKPLLTRKYASETLPYLPSLARYLKRTRPDSIFSATTYLNIETVLARRLAGVPSRLVLSDRSHFSSGKPRKEWRLRNLVAAMHRTYREADAITAVSNGVADDIARSVGIARDRITTLYNPTITPDFQAKMHEPIEHRWFADGAPPVLLGVGRTTFQKDFATLVRAFARVRAERPVRLAIIGESSDKQSGRLRSLAAELGVADDVQLLGYQRNPIPYMARSAAFVLSSRYEGFPNVLLEAMACGTAVVATDCPAGPREILDGGIYGPLVPVGDDAALAAAITATLDAPPDPTFLKKRAAVFNYDTAIDRYTAVILGDGSSHRAIEGGA